jgi:CDP-diacylglycerol--glycerol-3-phosphate 3-phosphatidyltransferase
MTGIKGVDDYAWIPVSLTVLRALLAPVVWAAAWWHPSPVLFGTCLVVAFVSDIFDGIIARRLGVATATVRRLDSIADTLFYVAVTLATWHLYPGFLREHATGLAVLLGLELLRYGFDYLKFRREAAYHMWSSKAWGISLFTGFYGLLVHGNTGLLAALPIYVGIAADAEGLVISAILREWRADVPSFVHALRARQP